MMIEEEEERWMRRGSEEQVGCVGESREINVNIGIERERAKTSSSASVCEREGAPNMHTHSRLT